MHLDGQRILSVTMVAIFGVFTALATTYTSDARLAPLAVGTLGLALSLTQLVACIRTGRREKKKTQPDDDHGGRLLLAWFAGFVAAAILVGIVPTALLLVFAFLRFRGREPLRTAATVAVVFAVIVYAVFELALGIPLFEGVLRGGL